MSERRPLPKTGHITAAHREIRSTVYRFRDEMLRVESQLPQPSFEPGEASADTIQFFEKKSVSQMYSRAVQVFAALTVEAFVNEYGYLRLGETDFEKLFKRQIPIAVKLTTILREVLGTFDENAEIVNVVRSLATRRNRLVHPRPEMEGLMEDGELRKTTERLPPDRS